MRRTARARAATAFLVAFAGPLALAPVAVPASAAQAGPTANIISFEFQPDAFTVDLGTTITWRNTSDRPHTVTDRGGTFDTDPILPNATGSVAFSTPGTYHFFCRINPARMNGVVTVRPGAGAQTTARVEALDPNLEGAQLSFSPASIVVETGGQIVFANVGGRPHTLTADDGSFDTGVVAPGPEAGRFAGTNVVFSIARPGTYSFHCEIHPQAMRGTITVTGQPRAGPAPAPASNAPTTASVEMADFEFRDPQVSVAPGGEVTFRNTGDAPHTATLDDEAVDTGTIQPGSSGRFTAPTRPGSYSYRCTIHPARMRGVIVVVGQNTDDPAAVPEAAARPPVAVGGGPGGGISTLALTTAVIGAFLGGFGMASFAKWGRQRAEKTAAVTEQGPSG